MKKTNKQLATESLIDAEMYLLITCNKNKKKIYFYDNVKDSALAFLGALEIEKQKLFDEITKNKKAIK